MYVNHQVKQTFVRKEKNEPEEFETPSQLNETARQTLIELDESGDERDHVDSIHEASVPEADSRMAMSSGYGDLISSEPAKASTREGFVSIKS